MPYHTELGADVRPWNQWSDRERLRFYREHGKWPEEVSDPYSLTFDQTTHTPMYKGAPDRLRHTGLPRVDTAAETVERINREREALYQRTTGAGRNLQMPPPRHTGLPANVERDFISDPVFDPADVQALGQAEEDEVRTLMVKTQEERNAILDKEDALTAQAARVANIFGVNVSIPSASRRTGRETTTDPAKGVAKDAANRIFTRNLLDAISKAPGNKLSDTEITKLLDSQNAGPDQIQVMKSMSDWIELGDIQELYKRNPFTGDLEYLYRYPYQITAEVRRLGWKDDLTGLKYQDEISEKKATQVQRDRIVDIQSRITNLLPFKDPDNPDADFVPRTTEEFYALKAKWGIKLPEADKVLNDAFPDLVKPGEPKVYSRIVDGKVQTKQMTLRELTSENNTKVGKENPWKPYDLFSKEQIAEENEFISNLAAAHQARVTDFSLDEKQRTPLTPLQFQQFAVSEWRKTGRTVSDSTRFNKQTAEAFMGERKAAEKTGTDLSTLMGEDYTGWQDFWDKSKDMDSDARIKMAEHLEKVYGDTWEYDGPKILFNDKGEPRVIANYADYEKARKAGHIYEDYNDAPQRKVPVVGDAFWMTTPPDTALVPVMTDDGIIFVHHPNAEQKIVETARDTLDADITAYEEVNRSIDKILSNLANDKGLTQMAAVRALEKLQDPTGVIRESDVELMKMAMGSVWDDIQRWATLSKTGEKQFLSAQENDQVANAALVALEVLQRFLKERLQRRKEEFQNDIYKTFTSKGADLISFSRVMTNDRYQRYTNLRTPNSQYNEIPDWTFKTSGFGDTTAPGERSKDEQALDKLLQ